MMNEEFTGASERGFRRSDFCGGVPITLVDGQEWFFAEPRMRFLPSDSDVGFEVCLSLDDGGVFNAVVEEYQRLMFMDKDEFRSQTDLFVATQVKMGRMMLERNYELPMEKLREILQLSYDVERDPLADSIRKRIVAIATGDSPKPQAGSDEASHSEPADDSTTTECSSPTI